jgi:N-methylhydantoinase A
MVLGVDVGGTFTDAVLLSPGGLATGKAPTTVDQSEGVIAAVDEALAASGAEASEVERLVHGMTVATNALLEGRTAPTALVATEGFTDLEELGRQARPELYRLCAAGPEPLVPPQRRIPAPERCGPGGVVRPLDGDELRRRLAERLDGDEQVEGVAVCLLWGFRHPEHERAAAEAVAELLPGAHVSTSHETAGVVREYERLVTTVLDAALSPLLARYLRRLRERLGGAGLPEAEVMLSSGGVAPAASAAAHGSWTVLSGPAGGAVAAARAAGQQDAVALDMGGTSCDVSLVRGGRVAVSGGREVGGRALALPMVDVHTVGAGGGSVAWRDAGGALRVGPRSAGADPGPACYGRGGELPTVTDANLLLGRLDASARLAGGIELDRNAAARALKALADELGIDVERAAAGVLRVAGVEMARAVRVVTVERGSTPRSLALVAFGGAGPLHAADIAAELGMRRLIVPAVSGVLSALGLAISERRRDVRQSVLLAGEALTAAAVAEVVERLAERGRSELGIAEPVPGAGDAPAPPPPRCRAAGERVQPGRKRVELRATYELRYAGQAFELPIDGPPKPDPVDLRAAFDRAHAERYGYDDPGAELELVTIAVAVALPGSEPAPTAPTPAQRHGTRMAHLDGAWQEAAVLGQGAGPVEGPAIVELPGSTLAVPPGWAGECDGETVRLERG